MGSPMHNYIRNILAATLISTPACRMLYITADQEDTSTGLSLSTTTSPQTTPTTSTSGSETIGGSNTTISIASAISSITSSGEHPATSSSTTSASTSGMEDGDMSTTGTTEVTGSGTSGDLGGSGDKPPECGNGEVELGEECDDGPLNDFLDIGLFCKIDCTRLGRIVFVTQSSEFTGKLAEINPDDPLSGVKAADDYCNAVAKGLDEVGQGVKFLAWISAWDGGKELASPNMRFQKCAAPYYSPKIAPTNFRILVASDYKDLASLEGFDYLSGPISISETGQEVSGNVLTATRTGGASDKDDGATSCSNWSDDSKKGVAYGITGTKSYMWTERRIGDPLGSCDQSYRLYCFEQCPPPP